MKIIINNFNNEYRETIDIENLSNIYEHFQKFSLVKEPLEAKIFAINESISSSALTKFKNNFDKINFFSVCIYSNDRDTVIASKSLKIDSTFVKEEEIKKSCYFIQKRKKIFFIKEQLDQETEYLQMETYALLET